jgi:hypothetical protein
LKATGFENWFRRRVVQEFQLFLMGHYHRANHARCDKEDKSSKDYLTPLDADPKTVPAVPAAVCLATKNK